MKREAWSPRRSKPRFKPAPGQPDWRFVVNLGDASPLDYGGYFVYRDLRETYEGKAELLIVDNEESEANTYTIYRIGLDRLRLVHGYLVPFKYDSSWPYPVEQYDEWFHKKLGDVAGFIGVTKEELEKVFTLADPTIRAEAYRAIGDYHGWENLDSDPLKNVTREQVEKRYDEELRVRRPRG